MNTDPDLTFIHKTMLASGYSEAALEFHKRWKHYNRKTRQHIAKMWRNYAKNYH